jgi:feS assembly ATPase sufC
MSLLELKNVKSEVEGKEILKGLNLTINKGEVHVIMGPNGAGKSTLASILVEHPKHELVDGEIILDGENINEDAVDERAKKGIFLSFQYPEEIPGLTVEDFLRTAKESVTGEKQYLMQFHNELVEKMEKLHINPEYADRHLNVGFSGGEKKKNEILQMAVLEPKLAILDETDSGLDIDATKVVFEGVQKLKTKDTALLIITHYDKVLDYLKPDFVHILMNGKIVKTGGQELVESIEKDGYAKMKEELGL